MKPEEKKLREELIGAEDTATFQRNYLVEAGNGMSPVPSCPSMRKTDGSGD